MLRPVEPTPAPAAGNRPAGALASLAWPPRGSVVGVLAASLLLVALIPFLPLALLSWSAYHRDVAAVESEISASNRQIAAIAGNLVDALLRRIREEGRAAGSVPNGELPPPLAAPPGSSWPGRRRPRVELDVRRRGGDCGYREALRGGDGLTSVGSGSTATPRRRSTSCPSTPARASLRCSTPRRCTTSSRPGPARVSIATSTSWSAAAGRCSTRISSSPAVPSTSAPTRRSGSSPRAPGRAALRQRGLRQGAPRLRPPHRRGRLGGHCQRRRRGQPARAAQPLHPARLVDRLRACSGSGHPPAELPLAGAAAARHPASAARSRPLAPRSARRRGGDPAAARVRRAGDAFNQLGADFTAVERELVQAEKTSLLGQLASGSPRDGDAAQRDHRQRPVPAPQGPVEDPRGRRSSRSSARRSASPP